MRRGKADFVFRGTPHAMEEERSWYDVGESPGIHHPMEPKQRVKVVVMLHGCHVLG